MIIFRYKFPRLVRYYALVQKEGYTFQCKALKASCRVDCTVLNVIDTEKKKVHIRGLKNGLLFWSEKSVSRGVIRSSLELEV